MGRWFISAWIKTSWKDKTLDYEIETLLSGMRLTFRLKPWKDKTLDYEIETPRLRDVLSGHRRAWKDKTLDYEIETPLDTFNRANITRLEKIRLSITRLKQKPPAFIIAP